MREIGGKFLISPERQYSRSPSVRGNPAYGMIDTYVHFNRPFVTHSTDSGVTRGGGGGPPRVTPFMEVTAEKGEI